MNVHNITHETIYTNTYHTQTHARTHTHTNTHTHTHTHTHKHKHKSIGGINFSIQPTRYTYWTLWSGEHTHTQTHTNTYTHNLMTHINTFTAPILKYDWRTSAYFSYAFPYPRKAMIWQKIRMRNMCAYNTWVAGSQWVRVSARSQVQPSTIIDLWSLSSYISTATLDKLLANSPRKYIIKVSAAHRRMCVLCMCLFVFWVE